MPIAPLKIAILHYQPAGEEADPVVYQIRLALEAVGHLVTDVAVHDKVQDILRQINECECDLVFNICETFAEDYRMEVNVAALLELARVPFTGSGTTGLLLAQDKIIAKELLAFHGVLTPRFATFDGNTFETHGPLALPLIVKPSKSDASIGLEMVKDWEEVGRMVKKIRAEYDDDALAEEFIEGREVYVGVVGETAKPKALPVVELDFGKRWKKGQPRIANREVKFGPETKNSPRLKMAEGLSDELKGRIERAALTAFRHLKLRDYARIDFRVSAATNEPYLLEVNPNPYLEAQCEVALAAASINIDYSQLIQRIAETAARRYGLHRRRRQVSADTQRPAAAAAAAAAAQAPAEAPAAQPTPPPETLQ